LVKFERKGSQFRRALKQQKRGSRRASLGFLDAFIQILESNQISIEFAYRLKGSARLSSNPREKCPDSGLRIRPDDNGSSAIESPY